MTAQLFPPPTDGAALAAVRERFLRVEPVEPTGVRDAILASWWRSRESKVDADHLEVEYVRDPNLDTPLTRSADPVLRQLREQLDGQAVSIVLTDSTGIVLSRQTGDPELERHLDRVHLAPGFCYAEGSVGTNGIGTALEAGRPMAVFGHEHYAEHLEDLACAGVPIRHPVSGKTVGVLDLTCWRREAGPLLMTLAKTTADQIRQALLTEAGMREIELLQAYLRVCRHSAGMVFALNNDVVMMNEHARTLAADDQAVLLRHAGEALSASTGARVVELPSGLVVRLSTRPVQGGGRTVGGVVDVRVVDATAPSTAVASGPRMHLPGLIGSGALWRRACAEVEAGYRSGSWLIVHGEPGTGKASLLQALHQRVNAAGGFRVLDPPLEPDHDWLTEARRTIADKDGALVLRHLDRLPQRSLRLLGADLEAAATRPSLWAAVALEPDPPSPELARLLRLFPTTVEVPPLRHHSEDVEQLVPFLLLRLGGRAQLTCSPEAMQLLLRSTWPGNVQQVLDTLRWVLKRHRTGVITPADLPPELQSFSRRRLSTMESLERDAIVMALHDSHGNKAGAARSLGMSRATIYRKVREYGILAPPT